MVIALWLIMAGTLLGCLAELQRIKEWHHGYYGLALMLIPNPICQTIGLILYLDDLLQHAWEAGCKLIGAPVPSDFTPIHKFGEWVILTWRKLWT